MPVNTCWLINKNILTILVLTTASLHVKMNTPDPSIFGKFISNFIFYLKR